LIANTRDRGPSIFPPLFAVGCRVLSHGIAPAKQQIGIPFLLIRHILIKRLEDRDKLLKSIGMGRCNFSIGLHIIDGSQLHAILLELFTREGIGTEIVL